MNSDDKGILQLIQLDAHFQTEQDGDEIFLKLNGKKIWPKNRSYFSCQREVPHIQLNIEKDVKVTPEQKVSIELWENDFLFFKKKLGEFTLILDQRGGPYITDLQLKSKEFARYSLMWEVR
jgi:hypothetical protein